MSTIAINGDIFVDNELAHCELCGVYVEQAVRDSRGYKFCSTRCQNRWYADAAEFIDSTIKLCDVNVNSFN